MRPLVVILARHLYGAVGLSILVLLSGWILVDIAELSRHIVRVGWHTVPPLYTMRAPVLLQTGGCQSCHSLCTSTCRVLLMMLLMLLRLGGRH